MSNVEIKAQVRGLSGIREQLKGMGCTEPELLEQEDVFFFTRRGRLKLRAFSARHGELIYYERSDEFGPTESRYLRVPCATPAAWRAVLGAALGIRGVVRKRREVYHIGQTRVHLDEVDRLGNFVEFEVVLTQDQTVEEGRSIARRLLATLNIHANHLIDCAYIDLLTRQGDDDGASQDGKTCV
jgi:predicted adenylyl cyclase CyaB